MTARPVDTDSDILPVLASTDLLTETEAVAAGVADHLWLFRGDWWEYAERGNEIFDLIASERITEKDVSALCSYVTSYLMKFPAVQAVSEAKGVVSGRTFLYSAVAHTSKGEERVTFSYP